jgi:cytochrome oxidase Cu insertion factor (SCO1/SenC/PrrC family)
VAVGVTRWLRHPLFAPVLALAALAWGTGVIVFLLIGPDMGGWAHTVLTTCFGWNASARAYRMDAILLTALEPPLFALVVAAFYSEELRAFVRRPGGRAVSSVAALGFLIAVVALLLGGGVAAAGRASVRDGRPAPRAVLTDHRGERFELGAPLGRPVALTFVYADCHASCPALIARLKAVEARVAGRALFTAVTLDPERDTVSALADTAVRWALGDAWRLLTGDRTAIDRLVAAHRVGAERLAAGTIAHENVVVLIDRAGRVAFTYRGLGYPPAELAQALERLVAERS